MPAPERADSVAMRRRWYEWIFRRANLLNVNILLSRETNKHRKQMAEIKKNLLEKRTDVRVESETYRK